MAQIADLKSELVNMEQNAGVIVFTNQTIAEGSQSGVGEGSLTENEGVEILGQNAESNVFAYEKVPNQLRN